MSHETYTPARGGSAAAEINALRQRVRCRRRPRRDHEHEGIHRPRDGCRHRGRRRREGARDRASCRRCRTTASPTPISATSTCRAVASHPVRYALRLAAGFGSQIAMALLRWTPAADGQRRAPDQLGYALPDRRPSRMAALARRDRRPRRRTPRGRPPAPAGRRRRRTDRVAARLGGPRALRRPRLAVATAPVDVPPATSRPRRRGAVGAGQSASRPARAGRTCPGGRSAVGR